MMNNNTMNKKNSSTQFQSKEEAIKEWLIARLQIALIIFFLVGIILTILPYLLPKNLFGVMPDNVATVLQNVGGAFLAAALISIMARIFIVKHYDRFEDNLQLFLRKKVTTSLDELKALMVERIQSVEEMVDKSLDELKINIEERTKNLIDLATSLTSLYKADVSDVYVTRVDAAQDMVNDINRTGTSLIQLIGISLNDFVRAESKLHFVWENISKFIDRKGDPLENDLEIQILIVHPDCFGAELRSVAEHREGSTIAGRLRQDVDATAKHLKALEEKADELNKLEPNKPKVIFKAKLYTLSPTLFLFRTNSVSYVQQYYFWSSRSNKKSAPVLRYHCGEEGGATGIHYEMRAHFNWLWDTASISLSDYLDGYNTGKDKGLYRANCLNVYNSTLGGRKRILWLLKNTSKEIHIMGISLKSFFNEPFFDILMQIASRKEIDIIRILIINPNCEQAKMRSFREFLLNPRTRSINLSYDQYIKDNKHYESDLCRDTKASLIKINDHLLNLQKIKVNVYDCAPTCFILIDDDSALVEQYHYGKALAGNEDGGTRILGKDMPLYEYRKDYIIAEEFYGNKIFTPDESEARDLVGRKPFELIKDHFSHIWENYSRPFKSDIDLK